MTKIAAIKTQITRKESYRTRFMQKRDDIFILDSLITYLITNLMNTDSPATQKLSLAIGDVLVKYVHEATVSVINSGV